MALAIPKRVSSPSLQRLLWPLLFFVSFLVFLRLTFPYGELARRVESEAQASGLSVTIGSAGPAGLLGIRARDVTINASPGAEPALEWHLARLDLSPSLFSLVTGKPVFSFDAQAYGGTVSGAAQLSKDPKAPGLTRLELKADDLDLGQLPLAQLGGVSGAGKLSLSADLPKLQPLDLASGELKAHLRGAALRQGALHLEGGMSFPVPELSVGDVDLEAKIDRGQAKISKAKAAGGDLDADLDGSLQLRPLFAYSQADLHARFHLADRWLNANPLAKTGLSFLPPQARQGDGSYLMSFSGPLSSMQPRPGR